MPSASDQINTSLIPPIGVIQGHISRNQQERALLRRLYRVAIAAEEFRASNDAYTAYEAARGKG